MTGDFAPFFLISLQALEAGFQLPLSEVGAQLCCKLGVTPGQLHPNTWRYIVAYIDRCREVDWLPTIDDLFFHSLPLCHLQK